MRHVLFYRSIALSTLVAAIAVFAADLRAQEKPAESNATPPELTRPPGGSGPILLQPGQPGGHPGGPPAPPTFPEAKEIAQPKNDEELAAAVKKLADTLATSGRFTGSILLAVDGKPLVNGAWGEADREQHIANTPETAFDVGSIGKLFTQIAILQLLEQGKLSLDDTFGKYLTDYPDPDIAGKITIRQLLLHSSGMGDIFDQPGSEKLGSMMELKDFLPLFVHKPLAFEPGSKNLYSNAGYIVLGMVI